MKTPVPTYDFPSNEPEHLHRIAKAIGRNAAKRAVFQEVYYHKSAMRSVTEIVNRTELRRIQVLQAGSALRGIAFDQEKHNGDIYYVKRAGYQRHKGKILKLAGSPKKLAALPTKRNVSVTVRIDGTNSRRRPRAVALTVNDLESFSAARRMSVDGLIPRTVSEDHFKRGVQNILAEPGVWKDWGGELFDLSSTRLQIKGKRIGAVFAFKGPGTTRKSQRDLKPLVPGMMGTNGDQIQRMFFADARVFLVQYHGAIKPSILQLLRTCALEKSDAINDTVYYGVIDGNDSNRLFKAYPLEFGQSNGRRKRR